MSEQEPAKVQAKEPELVFNLTITNGVAKRLQRLKQELHEDSAKEVVSLGLQIIDFAISEDAQLIAKKPNGEEVRIVLNKKTENG